jgi:hypothetical protein
MGYLCTAVFAELKRQCALIRRQLQPNEIMTDFESGVITAISNEFPAQHTQHKGCHFHFSQVLKYV